MIQQRVELIRAALEAALAPEWIEIHDYSASHAGHAGALASGGGHFTVVIVSEAFAEQPTIKRHQMVYRALGNLMQTDIHALVIRAFTPSENH